MSLSSLPGDITLTVTRVHFTSILLASIKALGGEAVVLPVFLATVPPTLCGLPGMEQGGRQYFGMRGNQGFLL